MAASVSGISSPLALFSVQDLNLGATPDQDIRSGATTIYMLVLDNALNAAATYFKIYNAATASVGTTVPDVVILVPASTKISIGIQAGLALSYLTMAAVTTGGTAGNTGPSSAFKAYLLTS